MIRSCSNTPRTSPAFWTLTLFPLYDSIVRVKSQAHWQTDVLAGWAIGTATGYLAHSRGPFILQVMPHGVAVGIDTQW